MVPVGGGGLTLTTRCDLGGSILTGSQARGPRYNPLMPRTILIVRTSSLGDVVHTLPAISDIARHAPQARIDWVVEEHFQEIPAWHPAVSQVIAVAHRRWRKAWRAARAERTAFRQQLDRQTYDVVLDMQALMKSVWIVRQTRGQRHGLDWRSAREPLAALFYDVRHRVAFAQPAVVRQRLLAASVFGYAVDGAPDFGLQNLSRNVAVQDYAMIMPSASRDDKLWPAQDWQTVFAALRTHGLSMRLLAGNAAEAARAQALAGARDDVTVLPRMGLGDVARMMAGARVMIGLDSGLTHLSAALGRPTIAIYKASSPVRTPLQGSAYTASLGERDHAPSAQTVLSALEDALASTATFGTPI